jgi:hypothetical protein
MMRWTACVERLTGRLVWVVPQCRDFVAADAQTQQIVHGESETWPDPAVDVYVGGTLRRATTEERAAVKDAVESAAADQALASGRAIITAAADSLRLLYPSLPEPTADQRAAFVAAVTATARTLLRAQQGRGR